MPRTKARSRRLGGDVDAAVGEAEADVDLGVEVVEGGDERRDQPLADAEGGGDVQRAARVLRDVGDGGLGLVDGVEDLLRALVEDRALLGRLQAAGGAVEEAHAEVALELGDAGGGDGGGDALVAAGGGHGAELVDADEGAEVGDVGHAAAR